MSEEIVVINPITDQRWDKFVIEHRNGTIFHHSLWLRLIADSFNHTPYYFAIEDRSGKISAGLPFFFVNSPFTGRRLVSIPFAEHCDPLLEDERHLDILVRAILKKAKRLKTNRIEFRIKNNKDYFLNDGTYESDNFIHHRLELDCLNYEQPSVALEALMNRFHKGQVIRNIKKALNSRIKIIPVAKADELKALFNLLAVTRKRHGLPPHPYKLFENMLRVSVPHNMIEMSIATEQAKPIAGIILARFKDTMYFLYGGSDYRYLKSRPNHLLLWRGIEKACRENLRFFDFGRTSVDNTGLRNFKKRWGTDETIIHYFNKNKNPLLVNRNSSNRNFIKNLVKRCPTFFLKIGAKMIYKHIC